MLVGYWLPWASIHLFVAPTPRPLPQLEKADAVLVFGALVRDGKISPLQRERLLAAKRLLDTNIVDTIVASNEQRAAEVMVAYLVAQGVPRDSIELDGKANKTPDTCRNERDGRDSNGQRSLIFLSQAFHLSRSYYQCQLLGVTGQLFAADSLGIIDRSRTHWWTKLKVRSLRYSREAALTWAVVLGLYK